MTPFVEKLIFGAEPPEGYKRDFDERGAWSKPVSGRSRWWFTPYPVCEVRPCDGCKRFYSPTALYSGSFPNTNRNRPFAEWVEGVDTGKGSFRHVCRACANRHDALYRRWYLHGEIASLIRRLEREIVNVRRKARAA